MSLFVPTIDISAYVEHRSEGERATVAAALDVACAEVGFMQIVGHGVAPEVQAGLASALDDFFGLPLDEKQQYRVPDSNRGYSPPKSESLSLSLGWNR